MADLLNYLIVPGSQLTHQTNSSEESFHSAKGGSVSQPTTEPKLADASANRGIEVYDIDTYLADPTNAALLESAAVNSEKTSGDTTENHSLRPVPVGTQTSHHVSALYTACLAKGLTPVFEIGGEVDKALFQGVLKIGDATIALDEQCKSKKEAKERLSQKGLEIVKGMEAKTRKDPRADLEVEWGEERNWVGMLQEYHNLEFGSHQSPIYTFYALGQSYACTVIIPSYADKIFGSPTRTFLGKKKAHRNAAAEGVRFLIAEGKLNPDGSTMARKKVKLSGGRSVQFQAAGKGLEVNKGATWAQKINDIAPMLGLNTPVYHLAPSNMNSPNILSGHVSFPNSPSLPDAIGEVRNVFGKKNAKEKCAEGAWQVLLDLAEKRGVRIGKEVDGEER